MHAHIVPYNYNDITLPIHILEIDCIIHYDKTLLIPMRKIIKSITEKVEGKMYPLMIWDEWDWYVNDEQYVQQSAVPYDDYISTVTLNQVKHIWDDAHIEWQDEPMLKPLKYKQLYSDIKVIKKDNFISYNFKCKVVLT
jgi:hypothetical protein